MSGDEPKNLAISVSDGLEPWRRKLLELEAEARRDSESESGREPDASP